MNRSDGEEAFVVAGERKFRRNGNRCGAPEGDEGKNSSMT
jgi:hypothetical protein